MNLNLSSALRTTKSVITANSPALLVGAAVSGIVATGFLAAKAGYKARDIVVEAELEKGDALTLNEKVQLTWLCYTPSALTGVAAITSVIGVHTIHTKRHAALAGLYAVATTKLDDTRLKAEELLGPKKTQTLNDVLGQKAVDKADAPFDNAEVILTGDDTSLCYDEWGGRWFMGSTNKVESAVNRANERILKDDGCTLNEFYDDIGLPPTHGGEEFGWSGTPIEVRFGSVIAPQGQPAVTVSFRDEPKKNLGRR